MAFGFISDVFEGIGDVILGERGSGQRTGRVTQIGATLAGAPPEVASFAGKVGTAYASGGTGQAAASTPTIQQRPVFAPESAMSASGFPSVYQPSYTAGFTPRLPSPTVRDIGTAGAGAMAETILDIALPNFFDSSDPCAKKMKKLVGMRRDCNTGAMCPTVTRKQRNTLRKMLEYLPIEEVAYQAGVDVSTLARLVAKSMPARRRGISGSQLATAKRVNNQILNMAGKLGYNVTPKTKAQLGCK